MSVQLPGARATFVGSNGVPTPEFYRFLQGLQLLQVDNASQAQIDAINVQLAELQAEIDALPQGAGYPILRVLAPLMSDGLLQNGFAQLRWNGTTSDVPEGSNLYFTDERAQDAIEDVRNLAINGAFDVWQNGTSFTHTGTDSGTGIHDADNWGTWAVGSSVSTTRIDACNQGVPVGCRYICRDVVTGVAGFGNNLFRSLNIEGTKQFEGRTFKIPLYVRAHQDCVIGVQLVQLYGYASGVSLGSADAGYNAFTLAANEWTLVKPSFTVPESTAPSTTDPNGTPVTQLRLFMNLDPSWGPPDPQIGTGSGVFDWALVTIREGGDDVIVSPLEETISACERYFEKSFDLETAPAQNVGAVGASAFPQVVGAATASVLGCVRFRQRKLYAPTVTLYNPTAANAHVRDMAVGADWSGETINYRSESGFYLSATSPAGSSAGDGAAVHWTADARASFPSTGASLYQRDTSDASVRVTSDGSIRICRL